MEESTATGPPGHRDFYGRPVLTVIGGVRFGVMGQRGATDVVHVSIVSLVGPDAGTVYHDVHVWTARVAGRLRALAPGEAILSKVVDSGKAPDLDDPDQWDQQAATAWFNANPGALDQIRAQAQSDYQRFLVEHPSGTGAAVTQAAQNMPSVYGQQSYAPQGAPPPPPPTGAPGPQYVPEQQYAQPQPAVVQQYPPQQQQAPAPQYAPAPDQMPPPPNVQGYGPTPNPNYQTVPNGQVANPTLESMRHASQVPAGDTPPPF